MRTRPAAIRKPRAARLLPLAAAMAFALAPDAQAISITVTSDLDSGAGTLRDAILAANAACDTLVSTAPVITFSGPFTISPSSPLPTFYCGVSFYAPTIDGGGTPTSPRVVLDGAGSSATCGLNSNVNFSYGGDLTVLGMKVQNFTYGSFAAGVCGASVKLKGNLFTNNSIGTWMTGGTSTVGGPLASDRNVFAISPGKGLQVSSPAAATIENNVFTGNSDTGIYISGGSATIQGNLVGTANGTTASGNGFGISLYFPAASSVSGNVISGNADFGLYVYGDYGGSVISDNLIGTNAAGTAALPNGGDGVYVTYSNGLSIGGNTISGNGFAGINFNDSSSIQVNNNFIGTNATESAAVPNLGGGIYVSRGSVEINGGTISGNSGAGVTFSRVNDFFNRAEINGAFIGQNSSGTALPNTRGVDAFCSGYVVLNGNTIASNQFEGIYFDRVDESTIGNNAIEGNGGTGVRLGASGAVCLESGSGNFLFQNTIRNNGQNGVLITGGVGNSINFGSTTGNAVKNININNSGTAPLPNDPGDTDGGPNNQQNWPAIGSVAQSGGQTLVTFTLDSSVGDYFIQLYGNSALGKAGGETFLDSMNVLVSGGPVTVTYPLGGLYDNISLTATSETDGSTSEFSPMKSASTAPAVFISPNPMNFGNVEVNTASALRSIFVRSMGDQPYVIGQIDSSSACYGGPICYGGAFICSTTCTTATGYATGAVCRIDATFAPSFSGPQTTSIFLCDNSAGSPNQIVLEGNAVLPPPIRISPTRWDFGDVAVGGASEPRGFTITNTTGPYGGSIPVIIGITGEFDIVSNSCGKSVPANGSCEVSVQFGPTQSGAALGDLTVTVDSFCDCAQAAVLVDGQITASAALFGNGVEGGTLTLPGAIDVGAAIFGGGAVSRSVELRNSGSSPVTFSSVTVSSQFTLVNNCPTILEPGQACTLVIGFTAPGVGPFTGTLTVVSDAAGGSADIPLSALGQTSAAPLLRLEPSAIGFGDRVIGSQSASQQVTIRNIGGAVATLNLAISTIDFTLSGNTCSATLEPAATCFAQVAFRPLGFGQRAGSLIVSSNAVNSPQAVSLIGTGCRPFVASGNRSGTSSNCAP